MRYSEKISQVHSLLVSPLAGNTYFARVDAGGWIQNKLFTIPLADIHFDRNQKKARVSYLKE